MASVSTIFQATTNALPPQLPALTATQASVTAQASLAAPNPAVSTTRLLSDPLSGVLITQYLDNSGDIVSQVPATTVVAYLRNGLSADGFPRESPLKTTA